MRFNKIFPRVILPPLVLLLCLILVPELPADDVSAPAKVLVTVHPDKPGVAIPTNFLGLSYEKAMLAESHFRPDNDELIHLFQNLGNGVVRFGGNKVETTHWQGAPSTTLNTASNPGTGICPRDLDNLYSFAKQSGWRVIHGLNLAGNNPDLAADEAAYALQIGGPTVLAFEVGNEPDYYVRHNLRPVGYAYSQYCTAAGAEQRAILARSPNAPLAGPATTKLSDWFASFVADYQGRVVLATSHFYSLSAKSTDSRTPGFPTVENLLSGSTKKIWRSVIGERQKAAHDAGIPFRLGECNTVSNGGKDGVSDVFASALWGVDFLFDVAELGVAGINFHGGFSEHGYTPFSFRDQHYSAHPLYYGMLLFHQAAVGRVVPVECQTTVNITAHAVLGDDGKLRVVLINKDLAQAVSAFITCGLLKQNAKVIRLEAPSVLSKDKITLAGSAVSASGTWTTRLGESVISVNGTFEVLLPAASALLLTVE
jgi:hypothetical protein